MKRMALLRRFNTIRSLYQTFELRESSSFLLRSSRSYITGSSNVPQFYSHGASSCLYKTDTNALPWTCRSAMTLRSTMAAEFLIFLNDKKSVSTQAKAPAQARQMGALKVSMTSPGFVYEPYAPGKPISFWKRYFTRSGWRRTKDDIKSELKSAYAIAKLRRSGYSKNQFYKEAVELFKEINTLMANGDKTTLRKVVTENMFSALKNEIKKRESVWSQVYWEMVEPIVKIRTLRARLVSIQLIICLGVDLPHVVFEVLLFYELNRKTQIRMIRQKLLNHACNVCLVGRNVIWRFGLIIFNCHEPLTLQ
ncbi:Mitochondrial inner membrane translocase complex isoform 2 [Theobroma cacao]|uniref:Large ribosomal subunit protein mL45 n=1 Tax=Theobroma cacao TaxID=3641 RepID=A0A061F3P4_THECC|nr:Mitochondrial inner membrane translocase complex isoform 2 [Theobroma cacao]